MLVSAGIIPRGPLAAAENLTAVARSAEESGLQRVWLGDRLVYPAHFESAGDLGREFPWDISDPQLEGIVAMTWMLAATTSLGVGISVMVVPLRQPLVLGRQLASMDSLSGGRVTFGVGVGGVMEEYDCAGVDRRRRGARVEEYVAALECLWTEERPLFNGEFVSFPELYCSPKPAQSGGIPLWFGGHTAATWDRVVRLGAGLAAGSVTPDRAAFLMSELQRRSEGVGRDPSGVGLLVIANHRDPGALRQLLDEHRRAGVTEVVVPVRGRDPEALAASVASIKQLDS